MRIKLISSITFVIALILMGCDLLEVGTGEPPATPTEFHAIAQSGDSVSLTWKDNSEDEDGFLIEYDVRSNFASKEGIITGKNLASILVTALAPETKYYFRIKAVNQEGSSDYSKIEIATTFPQIPSAPSRLKAIAKSASSIEVSWADNSANEDGFVIEYDTDADFESRVEVVTEADITSKIVTGLASNTMYYFQLKARNTGGSSSFTNIASATTSKQTLGAPSGLAAVVKSTSSIEVTWVDNSTDENGFLIEYDTTADFSSKTEVATGSNVTTLLVAGLAANTTYYIRIKARNPDESSNYSDVVSATTSQQSLIAPSNLAAIAKALNSIEVTWNDNSTNEDGFVIEFSKKADFSSKMEVAAGGNVTSRLIASLASNTKYYFRVKARKSSVSSSYSNTANATTFQAGTASFKINGSDRYTNNTSVTLNITYNAAVKEMQFRNGRSGSWSSWEPVKSSKAWSKVSGRVEGQFKDISGKVITAVAMIVVDKDAPGGSVSIENGAEATKSTNVKLTINWTGIRPGEESLAKMRISNHGWTPGSWRDLKKTVDWTLPNIEGSRRVNVEIQDEAGNRTNLYDINDSIILDTKPPTISSFVIKNEAGQEGWAYSKMTKLRISASQSAGITEMRFRNEGANWTDWVPFSTSDLTWDLTTGGTTVSENYNMYVYAQFRDAAKNESIQYLKGILYDAVARVQIVATKIKILDDTEIGDGELYWEFFGNDTSAHIFPIYYLNRSSARSISSGSTWNFPNVTVTRNFANKPGESISITLQLHERDSGGGKNDEYGRGSATYYQASDFGNGTSEKSITAKDSSSDNFDGVSGTMYFTVKRLD